MISFIYNFKKNNLINKTKFYFFDAIDTYKE